MHDPPVVVRVRSVDPRDQTWEVWNPAYRVYFWERDEVGGWRSEERELSECDAAEALGWARRESKGRSFTLYTVVRDDRGVGLIRLAGDDPTRT